MSGEETPFPHAEYGIENLIRHWQRRKAEAVQLSAPLTTTAYLEAVPLPKETVHIPTLPDLFSQAAIVVFGDKTNEGQLIQAVPIAFMEILRELERDPQLLFKIPWRKLEELIAGAYKKAGFPDVVLTPPSGDGRRDIIATKPGIGSIRFIDSVKQCAPHRRVTANDVRALMFVLERDRNVSKGIVTTTTTFAPGIYEELKEYMPYRLELRDGRQLLDMLSHLRSQSDQA